MIPISAQIDQNIICIKRYYHQYKLYDYRSIYPIDALKASYSNVVPDTNGYFNLMWSSGHKVWIIIAFVPMR